MYTRIINIHVLITWADGQNTTYQSYCVCLCAVNDFPRPPALCGPPRLRPGRNKKRIVRAGEQLRRRAEEGRDIAYRKQTRPYSTKASEDTPPSSPFPLCPHSSYFSCSLFLSVLPLLTSLPSSVLSFLPPLFPLSLKTLFWFPLPLSVSLCPSLPILYSSSAPSIPPPASSFCENVSQKPGPVYLTVRHESQTFIYGPASQSCYNGSKNILLKLALPDLMSASELETLTD